MMAIRPTLKAAGAARPQSAPWMALPMLVIALVLAIATAPCQAFALYSYEGEADVSWYAADQDVFSLTTAEQLAGLAYLVQEEKASFKDKMILLDADIDLGGVEWYPIGDPYNSGGAFAGSFDGQGHAVSGLYINNEMQNQALFGSVRDGVICNLTVYGSVTCSNSGAGIVASADNAELRNLVNYADVVSGGTNPYIDTSERYNGNAAGVVCKAINLSGGELTFENLRNYGDIRGASPYGTGGVIGDIACSEGGTFNVVRCDNYGRVYIANTENVDGVADGAGGVVGTTGTLGTYHISGCVNTGDITSNNLGSVGGVVGFVGGEGSTVDHSSNEGDITNLATEFDSPTKDTPTSGGVISRFDSRDGVVSNCYSNGTISASTGHSAGVIGSSEPGSFTAFNNYYLEGTATGAFNDSETGVASDRSLAGQSATPQEFADLIDLENRGVKDMDFSQYEMVPLDVQAVAETPADQLVPERLMGTWALVIVVFTAALVAGAGWEYRLFRKGATRRGVAA